jgi:hypothetical protein
MTERDPLRTHFEAFHDQSIRTTRTPPVEQVPRRLRRTRQRRAAATFLAGVALIALATVPSWSPDAPPTEPGAASSSTPTASPTLSPRIAPPGTSCTLSPRGLPLLSGGQGEAIPAFDPAEANIVPSPSNLFEVCPSARLPFFHVTYGWDFEEDLYVLRYADPFALTAAEPTVPRPDAQTVQHMACGRIEVLAATVNGAPLSIPRSAQDSPDPNAAALAYLENQSPILPYTINIHPHAAITSGALCTPSS